jgi:hypothetical protein
LSPVVASPFLAQPSVLDHEDDKCEDGNERHACDFSVKDGGIRFLETDLAMDGD